MTFLWVAFFSVFILSSVLAYLLWMFRGQEDVLRSAALIEKVTIDALERMTFLSQWLESIDRYAPLTLEEAEELDSLLDAADTEIGDIATTANKLRQKLLNTKLQADDLTQRLDELNQRINFLRTALSKTNKPSSSMRSHLA